MQVAGGVTAAEVPLFRKVEQQAGSAQPLPKSQIRLLADADFPPFSFRDATGKPTGLSIDLALLACAELKVSCSVQTRPFAELVPSLLRNDGDLIVSGLKLNDKLLANTAMTRPYLWSFGRFGTNSATQITKADPATLSDFKIGYLEGSGHAAWIEKFYGDATLQLFKSEAELHAAIKSGAVDVIFEDNLRLAFWLAGADSAACCKTLGQPFVDRSTFSNNLSFLARREDGELVKAFDLALDRLQQNGTSSKLLERYLPASFW
jgi:polar amino acid transport system substrate-binding protein